MIETFPGWENARRANVERRWPRFQWDGAGQSRWAGWGWSKYLFVVICGFFFSAILLDDALAQNGKKEIFWPAGLLGESAVGLTFLAFLLVVNGWALDRGLADRTLRENAVPRWLRWLRRGVVSLPVLGIYGIPLWRRAVEAQPVWTFRSSSGPSRLDLQSCRPLSTSLSRFLARIDALRRTRGQSLIGQLLLVAFGQVIPWFALLSWLTTADNLSPRHRMLLWGLTILCHLLAGACAFQYALIRGRHVRAGRWRIYLLYGAALFLLGPFPYSPAGLLLLMFASGEDELTLTARIAGNKSRPPLPLLFGAGSSFVRFFRLLSRAKGELAVILNDLSTGTLQNSAVKERQLAFCRLKAFLLLFDASALAWLLTRFTGHPILPLNTFPWLQIIPFLGLAALGAIAELAFLTFRAMGWLLRRDIPYQPYGRSVAVTQLALTAGVFFGTLMATGYAQVAGHLLILIGVGAALGSGLVLGPLNSLFMLTGRNTLLMLAWTALFFELFVTGAVMYSQPELAPPFTSFFTIVIQLTPIWSFALFFGLKSWLLHPFELGDLLERRIPGKFRVVLAAVVLTAAVPLGGIAVPFWIYAHHRLWPRYERLLWKMKPS